jgi:hypothetical protein
MDKRNLFFTCRRGFLTDSCCKGVNNCPDLIEINAFMVSTHPLWIPNANQVLRLYIKTNHERLIPIREIIDTFNFAPSQELYDINILTNILIEDAQEENDGPS